MPYFSSSEAVIGIGDGKLVLSQKSGYPYDGAVHFIVRENTVGDAVLSCYLPDSAKNIAVSGAIYSQEGGMLNLYIGAQTAEITVTFDLPFDAETPVGAHNEKDGVYTILRGNLMYSVTTDAPLAVPYTALMANAAQYKLRPLFDAYETDHAPRQVLFS